MIIRWLRKHLDEEGPGFEIVDTQTDTRIGDLHVDRIVRLKTPPPRREDAILLVEEETQGAPSRISPALIRLNQIDTTMLEETLDVQADRITPLVTAPFISERGRSLCLQYGVSYLDHAGNCHLRIGPYYIERLGNENPKRERKTLKSLFAPKATRVTRTLLTALDRSWALTELADATDLSLGHVHGTIETLEDRGYVSRNEAYRVVLDQPGNLLDAWAKAYDLGMHEDHVLYAFDGDLEEVASAMAHAGEGMRFALTLHAGARLVAPFTRYHQTHAYVQREDLERWTEMLDLRPVEQGGNVHLLVPYDEGVFHGGQTVRDIPVVGTPQLYVDLLNFPARGEEQARHLRREKLGF